MSDVVYSLVTGASGLIGREICHSLSKRKVPFLFLINNTRVDLKGGIPVHLDLACSDKFDRLSTYRIAEVYHCAAAIPSSKVSPEMASSINSKIDENIGQLCKELDARMIYISSTSVYAFPCEKKIDESFMPDKKLDAYSLAKLRSEKLFKDLGLNFISLRVNAPYGENQVQKTILYRLLYSAFKNEDLYYLGDGGRKQDFTHVQDIANVAIVAANQSVSGIFNISAGNPITMKELAHLIVSLVPNCKSRVISRDEKDFQSNHQAMYSIERAQDILGWNPEVNIRSGITKWIASTK